MGGRHGARLWWGRAQVGQGKGKERAGQCVCEMSNLSRPSFKKGIKGKAQVEKVGWGKGVQGAWWGCVKAGVRTEKRREGRCCGV